ncbi:MAG: PQQ-binding-like beta-propeller repeat protein [Verrucomicrobiales bacterium]|nr:PQQ-binding-like beta-propeller repeat protein [Verrucomicrobiales bacterium]
METVAPFVRHLAFTLIFLLTGFEQGRSESWPQFRGPRGDGVAAAKGVPTEFSETIGVKWKTPLPGRGWSSPVFDGMNLWMTTAIEIFPTEAERLERLKAEGGEEKKFKSRQVATQIDLAVLKVDYASGELLESISLKTIKEPQTIHAFNSFASPTPVLESGVLFAHFGAFGTFAVNTETLDLEWSTVVELEHGVGPGSSPFIHGDHLFLICDGVDRQFVTALDKDSGKEAWLVDRPEMRAPLGDQKKSYNTPLLVTGSDGREQLICMGAQWLISYDPATGDEIWRLDHGSGFSVVPRPVFSEKHQLLYLSTGFGKPVLLAVRVDGSGDITGKNKIMWREEKRIPAKPSPLLVDDELYVISDGGIATCFDALIGTNHWTERIDGNYSASPLFADGHIYFANQEGSINVIRPGKVFEVIATNQLDGSIMASPIALDGSLIIRSDTAIYRFSKSE